MNKITAIVLAAGSGSRMKSKTKKQFIEIKGSRLSGIPFLNLKKAE